MSEKGERKTDVLEENAGPSTLDVKERDQVNLDRNDERKIPVVVFSAASNNEEDAPTVKTDDECDEDCESFDPSDLMKFAWQIARGMVRNFHLKHCKFTSTILVNYDTTLYLLPSFVA